jgi:hypothetical protein
VSGFRRSLCCHAFAAGRDSEGFRLALTDRRIGILTIATACAVRHDSKLARARGDVKNQLLPNFHIRDDFVVEIHGTGTSRAPQTLLAHDVEGGVTVRRVLIGERGARKDVVDADVALVLGGAAGKQHDTGKGDITHGVGSTGNVKSIGFCPCRICEFALCPGRRHAA